MQTRIPFLHRIRSEPYSFKAISQRAGASSVHLYCVLVLTLAVGVKTHAGPFSAFEKNVEALNESVLMTGSMLVQSFGVSPATLSVSGSFQDSSWSASLSGTYASMLVNLSFGGLFDLSLDQGSFTSTGTIGTSSWNGSGAWSFADVDARTVAMLWDSEATLTSALATTKKPDKHIKPGLFWTRIRFDKYDLLEDFGKYQSTADGIPFGPEREQYSSIMDYGDPPNMFIVTVRLPGDFIVLQETANFDKGTVSGTLTVPEPHTLLLMIVGLCGLGLPKIRVAVTDR